MLNVAVVGLGWWGRTIVRLLEGNAKLRVATGVDVNTAAAADFAREHGLALTADFDAMLRDPAIGGVILCTPHSLHCAEIQKAAQAGKHVFCEKPLSLTRADVHKAVAACNAAGVALAVGHERRFEPPILEVQRLAKSGELGTLLQIEGSFCQDKLLALPADNWRLSSTEAPAGPMTATGIHLLDLSISLLGPADHAYASVRQLGSNLTNGDTLGVLVSFKSGANALISAILATPFVGRFAVYGNRGWVEVRDKSHVEAPTGWTMTQCLRGGEPRTTEYPVAQTVRANLEAFADAAAGRAPYPVPQDQMIANVSALEAIFKSAVSGQVERVEG